VYFLLNLRVCYANWRIFEKAITPAKKAGCRQSKTIKLKTEMFAEVYGSHREGCILSGKHKNVKPGLFVNEN